jgi:hypothetical protein
MGTPDVGAVGGSSAGAVPCEALVLVRLSSDVGASRRGRRSAGPGGVTASRTVMQRGCERGCDERAGNTASSTHSPSHSRSTSRQPPRNESATDARGQATPEVSASLAAADPGDCRCVGCVVTSQPAGFRAAGLNGRRGYRRRGDVVVGPAAHASPPRRYPRPPRTRPSEGAPVPNRLGCGAAESSRCGGGCGEKAVPAATSPHPVPHP